MFSFHKPKIYRSNLGCCICKAKSSSSRFTDSKKYENEFERCFRTQEKRSGEICNACVLLVKRWKKLSPDNRLTKHWHHVVDARAGPGTKVTGNRRITSSSSSSSGSSHNQSSSSSSSYDSASKKSSASNKSETRPLSSSQASNQATGTRGRTSSLSKARAIDTNVSTFTFGEPPSSYRRHAAGYSSSDYNSYASSASPKPQSALSSSAFESVIKRFRQRQQQQQLESQRRQMSRLERERQGQQILNSNQSDRKTVASNKEQQQVENKVAKSPLPKGSSAVESSPAQDSSSSSNSCSSDSGSSPNKRVKRSSENYGSHAASLEALKINSVLDTSIWRREKVCCGVIFRGPFNEVAIFPRLLNACDSRLMKSKASAASLKGHKLEPSGDLSATSAVEEDGGDLLKKTRALEEDPTPRAHKSGSISSVNSSTSGTGSMEPTLDEIKRNNRDQNDPSPAVRPRSVPNRRRRPPANAVGTTSGKEDVESTSTSGASTLSSGKLDSPSGSDQSSSRMMILVDGCEMMEEVEDDDEEEELVLADEEEEEEEEEVSSNDASSSAGSLVELDTKKSSAVA